LRVLYSEPLDGSSVDTTSVVLKAGGVAVDGIASVESGRIISFTPSSPLAASTEYAIQISGVKDADGGVSEGFARSFTTAATEDHSPPTVSRASPRSGAPDVGTNASIWIALDERLDPVSARTGAVTLHDSHGPVSFLFNTSLDKRLGLEPSRPLAGDELQTATIGGLTDEAGNELPPFSVEFRTAPDADLRLPIVSLASSESNTPIELVSSEPLAMGQLAGDAVTVTDRSTGANVPGTLSADEHGRTIRFVRDNPWTPGGPYRISVAGIRSEAGIGTFREPLVAFFYAGTSSIAPIGALLAVSPPPDATEVPRNVSPSVLFDSRLSADVTECAFIDGPSGRVSARAWSSGSKLFVAPELPLEASTSYTVTVSGVRGLAGGVQTDATVWSFVTGPWYDVQPPRASPSVPAPGETDVSRTAAISIVFDEPVAETTLWDAPRLTADNGESAPAALTLSDGGRRLTMTPTTPLRPLTKYRVWIGALTDLAGNVTYSYGPPPVEFWTRP